MEEPTREPAEDGHRTLYEFTPFRLDPVKRLLFRDGAIVSLSPRALDVLITLVTNRARALDKDELMRAVWADTVVEENNLARSISTLRKALGETASEHRYVVTIPGRGYRFVAPVRELEVVDARPVSAPDAGAPEEQSPTERPPAPPRRAVFRWAVGAFAAVLVVVAATVVTVRGTAPLSAMRAPHVVAVIDAVNETGEPDLDSLSGLLITSLEQSRRFRVLTRTRLRDLLQEMGHGEAARIDEGLGRAAAARAQASAVLVPVVRRFGSIYSVEVKGFDPASDSYLFGAEERGAERHSIPALIDRLSERTRRELQESAQDIAQSRISVGDTVTYDLEAYRHYFLGVACLENGALTGYGCAPHFRRALEIDPAFALAQYRLAYMAEFGGAPAAEKQDAYESALEHVDRFPARERMYMLAWRAHVKGDDAEAAAIYQRLVAAYPDDKEAQYLAGDLHFHREEWESAIPYFARAIALDRSHEEAVLHLVEALAAAGRKDEMLAVARRSVADHPGPGTQLALATALAHFGDPAALEAARRSSDEADGIAQEENEAVLEDMLQFFGRYSEAEERARAFLRKVSPGWKARRNLTLATALAYQGRRREGLRALEAEVPPAELLGAFHSARMEYLLGDAAFTELQSSLRWLRDHDVQHYRESAAALAYIHQLDAAADAARTLAPGSHDERLYRAVLRWRRGDPGGAADDLAALASRVRVRGGVLAYEPWFHAEALAEAGRDEEAIAALRRFQRLYAWPSVYRSWAYPRSLFLIARAHARRGEHDAAVRHLEQLLGAWRSADASSPLLREARELEAQLAAHRP